MSTWALLMRSPATCEARETSDWLSCTSILTGCFFPSPPTTPSPMYSSQRSTQYWSGRPKEASGPVSGVTKPILISSPISAPALTVVVLSAGAVVSVGAAVVSVGAALVVVVSSSPPQAVTRPPSPAPYADGGSGDAGHLEEVAPADASSSSGLFLAFRSVSRDRCLTPLNPLRSDCLSSPILRLRFPVLYPPSPSAR